MKRHWVRLQLRFEAPKMLSWKCWLFRPTSTNHLSFYIHIIVTLYTLRFVKVFIKVLLIDWLLSRRAAFSGNTSLQLPHFLVLFCFILFYFIANGWAPLQSSLVTQWSVCVSANYWRHLARDQLFRLMFDDVALSAPARKHCHSIRHSTDIFWPHEDQCQHSDRVYAARRLFGNILYLTNSD